MRDVEKRKSVKLPCLTDSERANLEARRIITTVHEEIATYRGGFRGIVAFGLTEATGRTVETLIGAARIVANHFRRCTVNPPIPSCPSCGWPQFRRRADTRASSRCAYCDRTFRTEHAFGHGYHPRIIRADILDDYAKPEDPPALCICW